MAAKTKPSEQRKKEKINNVLFKTIRSWRIHVLTYTRLKRIIME